MRSKYAATVLSSPPTETKSNELSSTVRLASSYDLTQSERAWSDTYVDVGVINEHVECRQNFDDGLDWRRRILVAAKVDNNPRN